MFLFQQVAKNVAKMVGLFATKVEALIGVGAEASQVTGPRTPMQESNIDLVNLICGFIDALRFSVARHTIPNSPTSVIADKTGDPQAIVDAAIMSKLNCLCLNILEPLLKAIADHIIHQLIPKMHAEYNLLRNTGTASAYVNEIQVRESTFTVSRNIVNCVLLWLQLHAILFAAYCFGMQRFLSAVYHCNLK